MQLFERVPGRREFFGELGFARVGRDERLVGLVDLVRLDDGVTNLLQPFSNLVRVVGEVGGQPVLAGANGLHDRVEGAETRHRRQPVVADLGRLLVDETGLPEVVEAQHDGGRAEENSRRKDLGADCQVVHSTVIRYLYSISNRKLRLIILKSLQADHLHPEICLRCDKAATEIARI